ncbi:unnamed protein product [Adineta ricciae]|uniref:RING-type domain-containing protein n=1 Tax=Adineta ricciae TaxID=249248 RepID=A0A814CNI6_ADIRI|nr:unnamed protein product [Adineta ricciae]
MSKDTPVHSNQGEFATSERVYGLNASPVLSTAYVQSQGSVKRQKTEGKHMLKEVIITQQIRARSFSHWNQDLKFLARLIQAGLFSCDNNDRVICIYCNLFCERWNVELDDPCKVHRIRSPTCPFVRSVLHIQSFSHHMGYIDREKRLVSFANWSHANSVLKEAFVDAGFFLNGLEVTCFHCNGSLEQCNVKEHPMAEHIRSFPYCKYARQLCGEALYQKLRRSFISQSKNAQARPDAQKLDEQTIIQSVADSLDLIKSQNSSLQNIFQDATIRHCFENQWRLKQDTFVNNGDLYSACIIHEKQAQLLEKGDVCVIPNEIMQIIYGSLRISNNDESTLSDKDIQRELEHYQQTRRAMGQTFVEDEAITIQRETSLQALQDSTVSRSRLTKSGLIPYNDHYECPHCHMRYRPWDVDDDPLSIHKHLSPLCLFVLSTNPFPPSSIPMITTEQLFTDEDIENADRQPYRGLVKAQHKPMSQISDRIKSFENSPAYASNVANDLAYSGIYLNKNKKFLHCFHCKLHLRLGIPNASSVESLKKNHSVIDCRYILQMNDNGLRNPKGQASDTCPWCIDENKQLMALPCRHFCLCKKCGQTKRFCPTCETEVDKFVIIYS